MIEIEQKVDHVALCSNDHKTEEPLFSFGLIGDVQYALDKRFGKNFTETETRYYHDAINKLKLAVECWNKERLNFCVNLGDLLDGRNSEAGTTEKAWKECLQVLSKLRWRRFDMVGNHELYLWGNRKSMPKGLNVNDKSGSGYYAYEPAKGWLVLVLNSFGQSAIPGSENEKETMAFLKSKNPNIGTKSADWSKGLKPELLHYMPYNGGLGDAQRQWLKGQLGYALKNSLRVIIFTHVEMLHTRTFQETLLFDHEEVAKLLMNYKGVVHTIFTGHHHEGGYTFHKDLKVHCYSILCPLVIQEGAACHAICHVCKNGNIELKGFGKVKSISLSDPSSQT